MSRSTAAVRFPDGTVRWGIYSGTSDTLLPQLFDSEHLAWETYRVYRYEGGPNLWVDPEGEIEEVEIVSAYGNGMYWPGSAARNAVVGPVDPCADGVRESVIDGLPRWYVDVTIDEDSE